MLSRRKFLQRSSIVSLAPMLPSVLGTTANAAALDTDEKVLVVVQMDGGNDGLNTVVPFEDDDYAKARETLKLDPKKLHKLNEQLGLHPSMRGAKELFDDDRLTIVQGVGYPNPDRSHFRSMKIWQTASVDDADHAGYGWLGKALDQQMKMVRSKQPNSKEGNAIFVGNYETPVALWGRRSSATSISRADDLKLKSRRKTDLMGGTNSINQFVTKQVLSAYEAAAEFERQELVKPATGNSGYPGTRLASQLKLISKMLKSGSQTRIYYTVQSGYDTHSSQQFTHASLLSQFSGALKAFLDDLKSAKLDDRVVVLAFSEFGRQVKENGSLGTDHGTVGPVFLAGSPVDSGLKGVPPDLTDLVDGEPKMQFDFRSIYATILDRWLGVDSKTILGEKFETLPLFRA